MSKQVTTEQLNCDHIFWPQYPDCLVCGISGTSALNHIVAKAVILELIFERSVEEEAEFFFKLTKPDPIDPLEKIREMVERNLVHYYGWQPGRCKMKVQTGLKEHYCTFPAATEDGYCNKHNTEKQCTAVTSGKERCRNNKQEGSDYCRRHRKR